MDYPVSESDRNGVRTVRLERPERLNALSTALRAGLTDSMTRAAVDDAVRVVLLTGAGDRGFCAGQDVKEAATLKADDSNAWIETWGAFFNAFFDFPKPIVTAINGVAAGGGLDLAMFGDVRVAVSDARFIMAEIDVGLPVLCGSFLLAQDIFWSRTLPTILTGDTIPAEAALDMGLVHEVVDRPRLMERARERAAELAAKPPVAMRLNIRRLRQIRRESLTQYGVLDAMVRYQNEAVASGEPQICMQKFAEERTRRKKGA